MLRSSWFRNWTSLADPAACRCRTDSHPAGGPANFKGACVVAQRAVMRAVGAGRLIADAHAAVDVEGRDRRCDADADFAVGADIDAVGGDVVVEDAQLEHGVFGACGGGGIPCRFLHPAEALEFGAAEFDADIDAVGG